MQMFVLVSALINKHSHFLVTMALQAFAAFFPIHTHICCMQSLFNNEHFSLSQELPPLIIFSLV